jgi:hypothetical protein
MAISKYLAEAGATPMFWDPSWGSVISTGSDNLLASKYERPWRLTF